MYPDQRGRFRSEGPTPSTLKNCGPVFGSDDFAITAVGLEHRGAPHICGDAFERAARGCGKPRPRDRGSPSEFRSREALREHHHTLRIAISRRWVTWRNTRKPPLATASSRIRDAPMARQKAGAPNCSA